MFGDPGPDPPVVKFRCGVRLLEPAEIKENDRTLSQTVLTESAAEVNSVGLGITEGTIGVGDAVDGWVFGERVGIAIRAGSQRICVERVEVVREASRVSIYGSLWIS